MTYFMTSSFVQFYVFADSQLSRLLFPVVDYDARRINSIVSRP